MIINKNFPTNFSFFLQFQAVKSSALALFFPFFVVAMIPYRLALKFLFTPKELDAVITEQMPQVSHKTIK